MRLTKDADALLCLIYKSYIEKYKRGFPVDEAMISGGAAQIHSALAPKWLLDDLEAACRELSNKGMLVCLFADDTVAESVLTSEAICYMENRLPKGIQKIVDILKLIKETVPGT